MIWACPLCQQPLSLEAASAVCPANHRFDRAKQGYLPLLPAHHRRSAAPGDDRQMLVARREFLAGGYFQALSERLGQQLKSFAVARDLGATEHPVTLLDSGCGEGYYLAELLAATAPIEVQAYGIDISKEAAKLCSKALPAASIAVASSFALPVTDHSVDVLLRVFAPGDSGQVLRVLKPGGEFWRVAPGPDHLIELKQKLYAQATRHELPATPEGFVLIEQQALSFTVALESMEAVGALLKMTPFVWRGSREAKIELEQTSSLTVTADFVIQRYKSEHEE